MIVRHTSTLPCSSYTRRLPRLVAKHTYQAVDGMRRRLMVTAPSPQSRSACRVQEDSDQTKNTRHGSCYKRAHAALAAYSTKNWATMQHRLVQGNTTSERIPRYQRGGQPGMEWNGDLHGRRSMDGGACDWHLIQRGSNPLIPPSRQTILSVPGLSRGPDKVADLERGGRWGLQLKP